MCSSLGLRMAQVRGISVTSRTSGPGSSSGGMSHSFGIREARSVSLRSRIECHGGDMVG